MKTDYQSAFATLHRIYQKHRRNHPENGDSEQMCCMWSTNDPPDIIESTPPFDDIEDAFGIAIDVVLVKSHENDVSCFITGCFCEA